MSCSRLLLPTAGPKASYNGNRAPSAAPFPLALLTLPVASSRRAAASTASVAMTAQGLKVRGPDMAQTASMEAAGYKAWSCGHQGRLFKVSPRGAHRCMKSVVVAPYASLVGSMALQCPRDLTRLSTSILGNGWGACALAGVLGRFRRPSLK